MRHGTKFAVMLLTAAALGLTGCEQARPVVKTRMEQPTATIGPTAILEAGADEPEVELITSDEPEEIPAPAQVLSGQETSPPTKNTEPVTEPTARPTETNRAVETAAPTATPKPTAEPTPIVAADPAPTATPSPTATAAPTATPKPTASPNATATPKPTTVPQAAAAPAVTATPKPTVTPESVSTPTPIPTATPHVHSWTMHEATGHYEARVTGTEEAAVGTYWEEIGGWDEDRAAFYKCNDCGAEFSSNQDAGEHILSAYHSSYSYFPAETVHHDGEWVEQTRYETRDVYEDVWVVDSEAYWTCPCGETRSSQP